MKAYLFDTNTPVKSGMVVATLATERRYELDDVVTYGDNQIGIIAGIKTSPFKWDGTPIKATKKTPVYIVERENGGRGLYRASDLDKLPPEEAVPDNWT